MNLIRPKAPRFYRDVNGVVEACYSMPKKSGVGTKEPTIADARELGLLPSVTTILGVLAKPGLERWKIEQAIHSALTLPRILELFIDWERRLGICLGGGHGEGPSPSVREVLEVAYRNLPIYLDGEDAFARRVVEDSEAQAAKAAEFGTRIHDAIAEILSNPNDDSYFVLPNLEPYLESFRQWARDNIEEVHAVEKVVGGKYCGYAGRLDLDCTLRGVGRCVLDVKTQSIKEGKEPTFWPDWCGQLMAYASATGTEEIMSLVIDSRAPGPVWPKLWTRQEQDKGWDMFEHCFELWMLVNDYEPGE